MAFDLEGLRAAVARHGRVTRVVIAALRGSSPREVGAAMLVWDDGQSGTIGGGALEFEAAEAARRQEAGARLSRHALGPDLGQCCGGSVTVLSEVYDANAVALLGEEVIVRSVGPVGAMPLGVRRLVAQARSQGEQVQPRLIDNWMIEPVYRPARSLWIWGAGHVGRALVQVMAPLPDLAITWVDTAPARFPANIDNTVTVLPAARPADLVAFAPINAEHLILTYSHALDLDLCHRVLSHGFEFAGLIGSRTKWARFRARLAELGHSPEQIARISCPIGDPTLGKHPQMIAVGVAAAVLKAAQASSLPLPQTLNKDQTA